MRPARPIERETSWTSAPTASQSAEISLMKLIFVARNALLAYLISSAVATFVTTNGTSIRFSGLYRSRRIAIASGSSAPITTRAGRRKSSTPLPSRRNSRFDPTEQGTPSRPAAAWGPATLLLDRPGGLHRNGVLRDAN